MIPCTITILVIIAVSSLISGIAFGVLACKLWGEPPRIPLPATDPCELERETPAGLPEAPDHPHPVTPRYLVEFPQHPRDQVIEDLVAGGWQDLSWHNDACPFLQKGDIGLFCEHPDPMMRTLPKRFTAVRLTDGCVTDTPSLMECNEVGVLMSWVCYRPDQNTDPRLFATTRS